MNKKKIIIYAIIVTLLSLTLCACGKSKESTAFTSYNSSARQAAADKQAAKNEAEYASSKAGKNSSDSFAIKASTGETLEAKNNYTVILHTSETNPTLRHSPSILLPYIGDYVGGKITIDKEMHNTVDDYYEIFFKFNKKPDLDSVKKYVNTLSSYGFTVEATKGEGGTKPFYFLNSSKKITHGIADYGDGKYYDMKIVANAASSTYFVSVTYPAEVGFDLSGLDATTDTITSKTNCEYINGKNTFTISGYGEPGEAIIISFDPNSYSKNDVIDKKTLTTQQALGSSSICGISVKVPKLYAINDDLIEAEVKILESNDSVSAISFYVSFMYENTHHTVEGVAVSGEIKEGTANTANSNGSGNYNGLDSLPKSKPCSACSGAGWSKCRTCGGTGMVTCTSCSGKGTYWANSYGTDGAVTRCERCFGKGKVSCTATGCGGTGRVNCWKCGGTGVKR